MITRLRLDAALYKPAPSRQKGQRGRSRLKGDRLPPLKSVRDSRKTVWRRVVVSEWYNAQQRTLLTATGAALCYKAGVAPVPIRWVLVRDPTGEHEPAAFLSTDTEGDAGDDTRLVRLTLARGNRIPRGAYTSRRRNPTTVVRPRHPAHHPGAARPVLPDRLWADDLARNTGLALRPNIAAWYRKDEPTFSDAIAAVRRVLWCPPHYSMSRKSGETVEIPADLLNRPFQTLCLAA